MKKFTIEMNETHMRVMTAALETFSRLLMGQIDIVFEQVPGANHDDRQFMQDCSRNTTAFKNLHVNASYGIGNEKLDDRANVAYEIKGKLEQFLYASFKKYDPMDIPMSYREPLSVSKQPFIKIKAQDQ